MDTVLQIHFKFEVVRTIIKIVGPASRIHCFTFTGHPFGIGTSVSLKMAIFILVYLRNTN